MNDGKYGWLNYFKGWSHNWSDIPEPETDYKFLLDESCPICEGVGLTVHGKGLTDCTMCRGKVSLPLYEMDIAWPDIRFGIEVQGGLFKKGGHSTGKGIQRDISKQQLAIQHGWTLVPVSTADIIGHMPLWIAQTVQAKYERQQQEGAV